MDARDIACTLLFTDASNQTRQEIQRGTGTFQSRRPCYVRHRSRAWLVGARRLRQRSPQASASSHLPTRCDGWAERLGSIRRSGILPVRPGLAIPREQVIPLDDRFGLHPSLRSLEPPFDQGHLAIVNAARSPDPTRLHFNAQDYMESGPPGVKSTRDGWNRGTDQGHGNLMFLLGAKAAGGRTYDAWPGWKRSSSTKGGICESRQISVMFWATWRRIT